MAGIWKLIIFIILLVEEFVADTVPSEDLQAWRMYQSGKEWRSI